MFLKKWSCQAAKWTSVLKTLPSGRAVAVDLPGYGGSAEPAGGEALSTAEKGELVAAAAAAFHLRRPVLVAASMSGGYAFPLLRDNPAAVGGFVGRGFHSSTSHLNLSRVH